MRIYFDNAATSPIDSTVVKAMHDVMLFEFGNPSSIHAKGRSARTLIEESRKQVAELIGASTGEIFFTSCATESNNMALVCSVRDLGIKRIITSPTEHPCVLNTVKAIQKDYEHISVEYVEVDKYGDINLSNLESLLQSSKEKTLVSLMHGNNEIGTMIDLKKVSIICESNGALFLSDTVQTIGKFPIDLSKTKISFISGSGHKIYGPKGSGFIYINNENMINTMLHGGGQERNMRSGTENIYGIVGFSKALSLLSENREVHQAKIMKLRDYFKEQLAQFLPQIEYNGLQNERFLPHVLSLSLPKTNKTDLIMFNLDINGICASAGSACASGTERDSHVLEAIQAPTNKKSVRFSFSHHNTKEEIDYTIEKLVEILQ